MQDEIQSILELNRDPVFAVAKGRILMMNPAAQAAFPRTRIGDSASLLFPDLIVFEQSDRFMSAVTIGTCRYTLSAVRRGETLFLSLAEDRAATEDRQLLSQPLMSGMLSALFNIRLTADRLRGKLAPQSADAAELFAILDHNYHLLLRRVRNLNALYALTDYRMELVMYRVDLVKLCADTAAVTTSLTRGARAPVEFCSELDTLTAYVDAPKVEQLILNLLSNSLKHTPADGQVRLKLVQRGSSALISVSDNGCGISPVRLKDVFTGAGDDSDLGSLSEEFGSGLGLELCRVIAEKHNGTLILESREGEGTEVRVLLPLSPPGTVNLMCADSEYFNGGMSVILTELSDLLDYRVYGEYAGD